MKTTKYLCLLLLCVGAISCKQEKLDDSLLTFRLSGECLVDGPWDEPIPSGLSTDKLKITTGRKMNCTLGCLLKVL